MARRRLRSSTLRRALDRSLNRLRLFVLASALLLSAGAMFLGSLLADSLRGQALDDARLSLTQYTNGVLTPHLVRDGELAVGRPVEDVIRAGLAARPDVLSVKVWREDGVLAWTTVARERIGTRFPLDGHLREAIETGEASAELEELGDAEDAAESQLGHEHVLEVYAPVVGPRGKTIGAFEIYADSSQLESFVAGRKRVMWLATAGVFAAMWLVLMVLVRESSRTLRRQTETLRKRSRDLLDSYRRLEESSLEAIESLNATVEAKDPYTAGHSQRVQAIAVAVAEELGLERDELDAIRHGALFHDIGKLAVPDAMLTKPGRLTSAEFETIKLHSAEGARIVGKLGSLRAAVPLIRHHHERWDGRGYPDGLAGAAIPLGAAIVGLADAWDAMTTDRPYQQALTFERAVAELRTGRGTQFAPAVVDAFLAALRRLPRPLDGDLAAAS